MSAKFIVGFLLASCQMVGGRLLDSRDVLIARSDEWPLAAQASASVATYGDPARPSGVDTPTPLGRATRGERIGRAGRHG